MNISEKYAWLWHAIGRKLLVADTCLDWDPFMEEMNDVRDLYLVWLAKNEDEFLAYERELEAYKSNVPNFMYKSADKFILQALELFKESGIEKPATRFLEVTQFVDDNKTRPFHRMIRERIEDTMQILERFKRGDKTAIPDLKDRGFM